MYIRWTKHAVQRIQERFLSRGIDKDIPHSQLQEAGQQKALPSEFCLIYDGVVYGCQKTDGAVVVKTVYPRKGF